MAYVAVKGGEQAIRNAEQVLAAQRRGDPTVPELGVEQVEQQLSLAVDRVMAEGGLYDRSLAALAIKQACGDLVEAIFLVRAYRTTLPRWGYRCVLDTDRMAARRRISAIFKDVPGGQYLGPTFDYTHRLLEFKLAAAGEIPAGPQRQSPPQDLPPVLATLDQEQLIQSEQPSPQDPDPFDLSEQPLNWPAARDQRLQALARADEGFLLSLADSSQRGYGHSHPFAGEIRMGEVELVICPEELGFEVSIGEMTVTEVQMITQFAAEGEQLPQFTRGYGLTLGHTERKAMAMALVDRSLRAQELGEPIQAPVQDPEFVLAHSDAVEAQGFVQHLKLPHYIDFQAELSLIRQLRRERQERQERQNGSHAPTEEEREHVHF